MNMRKAFTIILVFIVLINFFQVSIEKNSNNLTPRWNKGDSWIYSGKLNYNVNEDTLSSYINTSIKNFCLKVENENSQEYMISLDSRIHLDGYIDWKDIGIKAGIKLSMGKLTGAVRINKADLGLEKIVLNISGVVIISVSKAPIPIPLSGSIKANFNPRWTLMDFPLEIGKKWNSSESEINITISQDLIDFVEKIANLIKQLLPEYADIIDEIIGALHDLFPLEVDIPSLNMECLNETNITVPAGTYRAFLITIEDAIPFYFSECLANFIKAIYESNPDVDIELVSTTYSPPGAPQKPTKPSGKILIIKGREYTYKTSSIDENGNMIQYGWDWDGDGAIDEWTGWHNSGEIVEVNHTWNKRGKYEIRVKARNEYETESGWSEPLKVRTWVSFCADNKNPLLDHILNILLMKILYQ